MSKEDKLKKEKKKKRFNQALALVMVLFTVLPIGFSVVQSVSQMKATEQHALKQEQLMEETMESASEEQAEPEQSIMYQEDSTEVN